MAFIRKRKREDMKKLMLLVALTVAIQVSPAEAVWKKGNLLVDECLSESDFNEIMCYGYVIGIADMVHEMAQMAESKRVWRPDVCFPDITSISAAQIKRVVVKYLKKHPEETHNKAVILVIGAFEEAFPCE